MQAQHIIQGTTWSLHVKGSGFVWPNDGDVSEQSACFCSRRAVYLFDPCHSLVLEVPVFFFRSSLCIPAEWKAACGMRLGWEHRLFLLPHRERVCLSDCERVCVTGSDSPRLCEQHSWKVSCLCLQIDMISTHCQNLVQTVTYVSACRLTHPWSLLLFLCLSLSGVDFCSEALFTHPRRDSGCVVMLRPSTCHIQAQIHAIQQQQPDDSPDSTDNEEQHTGRMKSNWTAAWWIMEGGQLDIRHVQKQKQWLASFRTVCMCVCVCVCVWERACVYVRKSVEWGWIISLDVYVRAVNILNVCPLIEGSHRK